MITRETVRRMCVAVSVLGAAVMAACTQAGSAAAIQDGTVIGAQEQQDLGAVTVRWSPTAGVTSSCSGVLIANDWLLSAGHCAAEERLTPTSVTVSAVSDPTGAAVDAMYLFGGFSDEIGPDLSLMHLSRRLTVNGSTSGVRRPFWSGSMDDLSQGVRSVSIYGQGHNTRVAPPTPNITVCDNSLLRGVGTYRSGTAQVSTVGLEDPGHRTSTWPNQGSPTKVPGGRLYGLVFASGRTQLFLPGDSGGGTFIFNPPDPTPFLLGIHSGGASCNTNGQNTAGYDVGIPAVRDWLGAILTTTWQSPATTAYQMPVRTAEFNGIRWSVPDVNTVGWAQGARAASAVCYNRGAVGGHMVGHQDAQTKIVHCSGGDTAWFDLTQNDINTTGWGFTDVNTVSWARAGRAASNYCSTHGFVSGQFNGQQRDGMHGVFCYRGGAQYIDATDADIAATRWPVNTTDLDSASWAQAARAANEFCRPRGFVGGFLSGHHVPNKTGVVCQR